MTQVSEGLVSYLALQSGLILLCVPAVWFLARLFGKASAHWRYLLWMLVLLKCFIPPAVLFGLPSVVEKSVSAGLQRIQTSQPPAGEILSGLESSSPGQKAQKRPELGGPSRVVQAGRWTA